MIYKAIDCLFYYFIFCMHVAVHNLFIIINFKSKIVLLYVRVDVLATWVGLRVQQFFAYNHHNVSVSYR